MTPCPGTGDEHCCVVSSQVCPLLRDDGPEAERRWVCTVRERAGDWETAVADPAYRPIGEHWVSIGQPFDYCQVYDASKCVECMVVS